MEYREDKYQEIERIERQLQELENKINAKDGNFHKTVKHEPEASHKVWQKKVVLGLKLFALTVVAIAAVKLASMIMGIVILGLLIFVTYKLFLDTEK
ncbi:MAG: DUF3040 domain-containing protein [Stigonema ocellatum SAG 48.90 = DSM 106950]|nr:DUF3040 domain-containing protein [Stigonema ocellatum SAG 48.90 = DSM 106950]